MNKTVLEVLSWNEPVIENFSEENSINIAKVEYKATGHLEGKISSVYVLHYTNYNSEALHEAKSTFTGYSIFTGIINDNNSRIVFYENGKHENGLESTLSIKKVDSELSNISGLGKYSLINGKVILETEY